MTETLDSGFVELLNSFGPFGNLLLAFLSLFFATFLSGLIGFERESMVILLA